MRSAETIYDQVSDEARADWLAHRDEALDLLDGGYDRFTVDDYLAGYDDEGFVEWCDLVARFETGAYDEAAAS